MSDKKEAPAATVTAGGSRQLDLVVNSLRKTVPQVGTISKSVNSSDYSLYADKCQHIDPLDALLAQAERQMELAGNDMKWIHHFRIWLSLSHLKYQLKFWEVTS